MPTGAKSVPLTTTCQLIDRKFLRLDYIWFSKKNIENQDMEIISIHTEVLDSLVKNLKDLIEEVEQICRNETIHYKYGWIIRMFVKY